MGRNKEKKGNGKKLGSRNGKEKERREGWKEKRKKER